MPRKLSIEEWIEKARKVHGDRYDYSKVEYVDAHTKVTITCPIHGDFIQTPNSHLNGGGCPKCGGSMKLTTQEFIARARKIHGDKYDYSKVDYINANKKVCIICPIHGEFWQTPSKHLNGRGCNECGIKKRAEKQRKTFEDFLKEARKVHGDKYDYSKVEYKNAKTKICIICPKHGMFYMTPSNHLQGQCCPKCKYETLSANFSLSKEEFIEIARQVHGDKYDYSKVEYINNHTYICIICPKHGEFWQRPINHINGNGCPKCKSSHLEVEIRKFLIENNIEFCEQKRFEWLGRQSLDFYLPKHNIAIECQGIQHFSNESLYGRNHEKIKKMDKLKNELCASNNVELLYYSNLGLTYSYKVYESKEELLEIIATK